MSKNISQTLLVLLLWLAGLLAALQFAKIAIPFSEITRLYPEAGDNVGWLLSIISLVGAVLGVFTGALVAWLGAVRILLGGLIFGALISLWQASLPSLPIMLLSRMLEGISHLAIVVAAPTLIAQVSSQKYRGVAMALWSTFFGVSFALFAWLGMPIVLTNGLSVVFTAFGWAMIVIAGLLAVFLLSSGNHHPPISKLHFSGITKKLASAYGSPSISAPGIGWLFYTFTFVALLAIIPERLPLDIRNWVSTFMPIASIIVSIIAVPLLLRAMKATSIVMLGFTGAFLVLIFPLDAPLAYVAIAIFSVLGLTQGASFAAVPQLNKSIETQALSYGLMAQMGNLGNLLGTPLLLLVLGQSGETGMFTAIAILYATAVLAHLILAWQRSKTDQSAN